MCLDPAAGGWASTRAAETVGLGVVTGGGEASVADFAVTGTSAPVTGGVIDALLGVWAATGFETGCIVGAWTVVVPTAA